jgi:hypothetical protein
MIMVRPQVAVLAVLIAMLLIPSAPATAQEVVLRGASDVAVDRRLGQLLELGPHLISRNTTIERGDTIRGSVLVLDASLIHEGVITGDLVLVGAGAFVRPRSVVGGDLVNVAGGLYRSELASVGGRVIDLPVAPYRVVREPDVLVIEATRSERRLVLEGIGGLNVPTYDRVNGVTLLWGAGYRLPYLGRIQPQLNGRVGWHTQRGAPGYAASLEFRRGANMVSLGHERAWDTNERWIREDLLNSIGYLLSGRDLRDYHEVERSWLEVSRSFADRSHRINVTVALRGQVEDATSLVAGEPWYMFGSGTRANLPVHDGRIVSALVRGELAWEGDRTRFDGDVEYEAARQHRGGELHFGRVRSAGNWAMQAFSDHTLAIDYMIQRPVGAAALPGQRWSFVGGPGTLFTLPMAGHYGDRVVFVESRYIVPLPEAIRIPLLGTPRLQLAHAAGMAWTGDDGPPLHQEMALILDLPLLYVRYSAVPDDPGINDLRVGLSWPIGRRYPWED